MSRPATILRITPHHLSALITLEAACFPETTHEQRTVTHCWTEAQLQESLNATGFVGVIVADAGYAFGNLVLDELELFRIGVHPQFRRKGLGKQLLAAFAATGQAKGAESLFLEVRADNQPARDLYGNFGMVEVGARPRYYTDGVAAVLYSKSPI